MTRTRTIAMLAIVAIGLGIAGEAIVEFLLTPQWAGRVIVVVLLAQAVSLIYLVGSVVSMFDELQSQHRAATYVSTMWGLLGALAVYAEAGGVDVEYRRKVHGAVEEQYDLYQRAISGGEGLLKTESP